MRRSLPINSVFSIAMALLVMAGVLLSSTLPSSAQQKVERKSFLEFLFGKRRTPASDSAATTSRTSRPKRPTAGPTVAPEPEVTKIDNAKKILVLGDFLANGMAEGLTEGFVRSPGVVVVDRTNGSSGLVRDDYYNWPEQAPAILDEVRPDIVVIQLGSNDRQQLVVNDVREAVRSPSWMTEYQRRTDQLIATVTERKLPLLWVGLPAFKSPSMSADIIALNGVYRSQVERAGGEFIDIWDGFVDESGKFIFTGSDINGQQVRLRGSDGINLTRAGRRKVAFYVEKSARRLLGSAADTDIAKLGADNLPDLTLPTAPGDQAHVVRTSPISMTDPDLDGGSELLGETPVPATLAQTPRDLLVGQGISSPAPEGRADDFTWPRPLR